MVLLSLLSSACSVKIKDETFFIDAGESGAVTVNFLSTGSTIIDKAAWDSMREGMFCMSSDAIGDIKGEVEKLCSRTSCTYEQKQYFYEFMVRVSNARKLAASLARPNSELPEAPLE